MAEKKESFDLNTAVSFLPVMDDTENVTRQLISSINMYNSLLDEKSKPLLINFILSSRLSSSAKVRLTKNYKTVDHLVNDMNQYLLPKKSFPVIQQQLSQCTQKQKSIDTYGNEIEKLFVELTIAQADGDQHKQKILRPVNERMAINQFASGLQNDKLRTIILSRNYKSLKDAIQGAKDEQTSMSLRASNVKQENKPTSNNNTPGSSRGRGQGYQGRGGQSNQINQRPHNDSGHGRGVSNSVPHHNQYKTFDNLSGKNNSLRGQGQCARGNSRGGHNTGNQHHQGTTGKTFDNRDGTNHSQRGQGQHHRGNSRGGHNSGNQHPQGAPNKNFDNGHGDNQSQRGRGQTNCGNTRGNNQRGAYHNQGNRGRSGNHGVSNNQSVSMSAFQLDCQLRFTATAGGFNVTPGNNSKNTQEPNKNKQLSKYNN